MEQKTKIKSMRKRNRILAFSGIITAISIVLVLVSFKNIIPAAPYLEYNPSDIPILVASVVLGPLYGAAIALAVSAIQALTISVESGMYGFIMHVSASCVLAFVSGIIFCPFRKNRYSILSEKKSTALRLLISLVGGGIASVLVMIPMNLIFVQVFMNSTFEDVVAMIVPIVIPYNVIKMILNCVGAYALIMATRSVLIGFISETE